MVGYEHRLESGQQELIDRLNLIEVFKQYVENSGYITMDADTVIAILTKVLSLVPVIDHRIDGKWISVNTDDLGFTSKFKCSVCYGIYKTDTPTLKCFTRFCPHCGSKMSSD